MSTEWTEVFPLILAEKDLLSTWELGLVQKCQLMDSQGLLLNQDQKDALQEVFFERVIEKIPSRNRQEES